jgi:hypothetical protein
MVFLPLAATNMDPDLVNTINNNATPPIEGPSAGLGRTPPGGSQCLSHKSSSQQLHPTTSIALCISLAAGSATFGYIYIAEGKCHQAEDAITAYFSSAGREVTILPCPDFDTFMANYSLVDCDVSFFNNLS